MQKTNEIEITEQDIEELRRAASSEPGGNGLGAVMLRGPSLRRRAAVALSRLPAGTPAGLYVEVTGAPGSEEPEWVTLSCYGRLLREQTLTQQAGRANRHGWDSLEEEERYEAEQRKVKP